MHIDSWIGVIFDKLTLESSSNVDKRHTKNSFESWWPNVSSCIELTNENFWLAWSLKILKFCSISLFLS
ncbi:unnamed protein product [Blepharisma stoltei]|uniref:Uncharacterized protein n=1 Tax=Blepharisma stoltei TaxID=1481888 RepID=A0AAU9JB76_9CILI|nr:unnamed protein product [Blepharisma stoltei]CAG9324187.1 unnamed protein product [Blepharisma stoltei]